MFLPAFLLAAVAPLVPDAPGAEFRQPQLATTHDLVGMTFGSGNSIYYTYSKDYGRTFVKPIKVADVPRLYLGRHRGPRIAYMAGNVVISAIAGSKPGANDGNLFVWLSDDNGGKWSKPIRVNDTDTSAREGLHDMVSGNGMVYAVWLDLRAKGTRLFGARSTDGGLNWSRNMPIYESPGGSICECCHPTVLIGHGGRIHVMWRNSLEGYRDMYTATSHNGGLEFREFSKLGKDTWQLNACPMDGGDLAVGSSGDLWTTWRREDTIFVARPGHAETPLGKGKDPALTTGLNERVSVVWSSPKGIEHRSNKNHNELLSPEGAYPQIQLTPRAQFLVVWEQGRGIATTLLE